MTTTTPTPNASRPVSGDASRGLIQGGQGGPEAELLEDGQEEVFSRSEVERGAIEHRSVAGGEEGTEREDQPE